MNTNKNKKINDIYEIIFISLTLILGLLFTLFTCAIYFGGKKIKEDNSLHQIYTTEIIGKYLGILLIPLIIWILLIIFGIVIKNIYPLNKKKIFKKDDIEIYNYYKKRISLDIENYDNQIALIKKERKNRLYIFIGVSILCLMFMILPARYLFNKENFISNESKVYVQMAFNVFPFVFGSFIIFGLYLYDYTLSIKKELVAIKEILKTYKPNKINNDKKGNNLLINITRISVLIIGITFTIIGILNGGPSGVLSKALAICMECIGCA